VGIVSTGGEIENMRRIAVTDASGSLGGQVVRLLAEQTEADVVALSRRPTAVPPRVIPVCMLEYTAA
jgi:uncharacterized protein YbjT (DUF2867 family)